MINFLSVVRRQLTRRLRRIHNAWPFQFQSGLVFKVQWFRFGGWRCSPLNAALSAIRESHQKVGKYEH